MKLGKGYTVQEMDIITKSSYQTLAFFGDSYEWASVLFFLLFFFNQIAHLKKTKNHTLENLKCFHLPSVRELLLIGTFFNLPGS